MRALGRNCAMLDDDSPKCRDGLGLRRRRWVTRSSPCSCERTSPARGVMGQRGRTLTPATLERLCPSNRRELLPALCQKLDHPEVHRWKIGDMPRGRGSNGSQDLRPLLLHYIRSKGASATIASLLDDPVVAPFIRGLTIGELGGGRSPNAPSVRPSGAGGGRKAKEGTRTAAGRKDYDARVLAAIKAAGASVAAEDVINSIGGTGLQFRTATKRLIASRKIKRTGKARGTRYAAV